MKRSPTQAHWLYVLQQPWPLTDRPLQTLAETLGTSEATLLDFLDALRRDGLVRRIGAIFDARRLGYRSCLFALPSAEESTIARLVAHPGVTHAYLRSWPEGVTLGQVSAADYAPFPKLWYTLSAPMERFEAEAATFADLHPIALPALARYKIDVIFDTRTQQRDERTEYRAPDDLRSITPPTPEEQALVRRYQGDTATPEAPFRAEDLPLLQRWQRDGTMRRFALLLAHRPSGFIANGMCCWRVPEAECDVFGRRLAACAEVTHCYARPAHATFPFNLYAMIHKTSWAEGYATFQRLTQEAGLPEGRLFFSTQEFKKQSLNFFPQ